MANSKISKCQQKISNRFLCNRTSSKTCKTTNQIKCNKICRAILVRTWASSRTRWWASSKWAIWWAVASLLTPRWPLRATKTNWFSWTQVNLRITSFRHSMIAWWRRVSFYICQFLDYVVVVLCFGIWSPPLFFYACIPFILATDMHGIKKFSKFIKGFINALKFLPIFWRLKWRLTKFSFLQFLDDIKCLRFESWWIENGERN